MWNVVDVEVSGNNVFIADDGQGMRIIDISNPIFPEEKVHFDTDGSGNAVSVNDDFAYIADGYYGLRIIDISNLSQPKEVGYYDTIWDAYDVVVRENFAYLIVRPGGLRTIDISDKSNPVLVHSLETGGWGHDLKLNNTNIFMADGDTLRIIDISSSSNPKQIGYFRMGWSVGAVAVQDSYAFLGDRVLEISDLKNIQEIWCSKTPYFSRCVLLNKGYAYVASGSGGLKIFDITIPSNLKEIYHIKGDIYDIAIKNNYAYLASMGLRIINISDPNNPIEVGHSTGIFYAWGIDVKDNYAYLADKDYGIRIFNISNPENPNEVSSLKTNSDIRDIAIHGTYAYVANGREGSMVIDVSNPHFPNPITDFNKKSYTLDVVSRGPYAYFTSSSGLQVFDISNSGNPISRGYFDRIGGSLTINGSHLYVGSGSYGLYILQYIGLGNPPNIPELFKPDNDTFVNDNTPTLIWHVPEDRENDSLHFSVEIASDHSFSNQILNSPYESWQSELEFNPVPLIPSGSGFCSFTLSSLLDDITRILKVMFIILFYSQNRKRIVIIVSNSLLFCHSI